MALLARSCAGWTSGRTWFSRAFDLPTVLGRWGAHVPPEHVHLVTVPPSGASRPGDDLWHRFCRVVGIDPGWAPEQSTRANAVPRCGRGGRAAALNKQLDRMTRREAAYDGLIRSMLAEDVLAQGDSPRITLPPDAYEWVDRTTGTWIEWIEQSGIDVVGDVDELWAARPGRRRAVARPRPGVGAASGSRSRSTRWPR